MITFSFFLFLCFPLLTWIYIFTLRGGIPLKEIIKSSVGLSRNINEKCVKQCKRVFSLIHLSVSSLELKEKKICLATSIEWVSQSKQNMPAVPTSFLSFWIYSRGSAESTSHAPWMQRLCILRKQVLGILLSHFSVILLLDVGFGRRIGALLLGVLEVSPRSLRLRAEHVSGSCPPPAVLKRLRGGEVAALAVSGSPVGYLAMHSNVRVLPCLCRGREWKGSDALFSVWTKVRWHVGHRK